MKRAKMERGAFPTAGFPIPELAIRSIFLVPVSVPVLDLILTLPTMSQSRAWQIALGRQTSFYPTKKKKKNFPVLTNKQVPVRAPISFHMAKTKANKN